MSQLIGRNSGPRLGPMGAKSEAEGGLFFCEVRQSVSPFFGDFNDSQHLYLDSTVCYLVAFMQFHLKVQLCCYIVYYKTLPRKSNTAGIRQRPPEDLKDAEKHPHAKLIIFA